MNAEMPLAEIENLGLIAFGIFVTILALGIVLSRLQWRKMAERAVDALREFAAKHGLKLVEEDEDLLVFEGQLEGRQVKLRAGERAAMPDDRKKTGIGADFASIAVACARPWPKGLQLWRESQQDMQRKTSRKLNEIEVGDRALDRGLIIRGASPAEIKAFVTRLEIRDAVLEFFERWPESMISDHWILCEEDGVGLSLSRLEAMLDSAMKLAALLDERATAN